MGKSWLMCVLLGTLAWGQAAPGAPPKAAGTNLPDNVMPQSPAAQADTSAEVPPDAAVITVIGICPAQPEVGAAQAPTAGAAADDCKTVITKAEFEKLIHNLTSNVTPQAKKQLSGLLPRWLAMSAEAKKKGMDQTPQFEDRVKVSKMQLLTQAVQQNIQDEAANVPPEEVEKYYNEHADAFEQFNVDRLFVPRTKQPDAELKDEDEKDEKLSEPAKKAKEAKEKAKADAAEQSMTKLAESLRARAAAGEDIAKLQKEAFDAAGMKIASPNVNLPTVRRTALQAGHAAVFDLKPGEVSHVISDAGGHYIYKLNSKSEIPLDQAKNEIHSRLQNDRTREMLDKVNNSFKVETNDAYFGPGGQGAAPPPRVPRPRPTLPPPGQQQTPPPAQPPAAKPN
jgi:PPIC-type PPIASE domain